MPSTSTGFAPLGPIFMEAILGSLYISWKVISKEPPASFDLRLQSLAAGRKLVERSIVALPVLSADPALTQDGPWRVLYMDPKLWGI